MFGNIARKVSAPISVLNAWRLRRRGSDASRVARRTRSVAWYAGRPGGPGGGSGTARLGPVSCDKGPQLGGLRVQIRMPGERGKQVLDDSPYARREVLAVRVLQRHLAYRRTEGLM